MTFSQMVTEHGAVLCMENECSSMHKPSGKELLGIKCRLSSILFNVVIKHVIYSFY